MVAVDFMENKNIEELINEYNSSKNDSESEEVTLYDCGDGKCDPEEVCCFCCLKRCCCGPC